MVIPREKCASLENAIFHIIFASCTSFNALFGFDRARAGYYRVCVPAKEAMHTPCAQQLHELAAQHYSNHCDAPRNTSEGRFHVRMIRTEILQSEFPSSKTCQQESPP